MENINREEAENLAAPSTPDSTGQKKIFAVNREEMEEAENWGPFEHVEPKKTQTATMKSNSKNMDTSNRAPHPQ